MLFLILKTRNIILYFINKITYHFYGTSDITVRERIELTFRTGF